MPIPDFQTVMLPILQCLAKGRTQTIQEIRAELAKTFQLSPMEASELMPDKRSTRFYYNIRWALTYLKTAQVVERPERGKYRITQKGKEITENNVKKVDLRYLSKYPEFRNWRKQIEGKEIDQEASQLPGQEITPEEALESGHEKLRRTLAHDLLEQIKQCSPRFFEKLAIEILVAMGYGGSLKDAGQVIGKSGDGGIDGVIKEDKLGLDIVYIQAKRWEGPVPARDVRDFTGSLERHGAKKGVFITTSNFTPDGHQFVSEIREKKIVLIEGYELAQLMIDYNIGVSTVATYELKRIDSDYFEEE